METFPPRSRIDFILISKPLDISVLQSDIGIKLWSDIAWTECQLMDIKRKDVKPQWCLNIFLLLDEEICADIVVEFQNYFKLNSNCRMSQDIICDAM